MSYEPTNWKNGDIITAEKLNKIENGISTSASPLIIYLESVNRYTTIIDAHLTTADFINAIIITVEESDSETLHLHYPETIQYSSGDENISIHSGNTGQLFFYTPSSGEIRLYVD